MLYCWALIVACDVHHLSSIAWWMGDASIFIPDLLVQTSSGVLDIQHCDRSRMTPDTSCLCRPLESDCHFFSPQHNIGPYLVEVRSVTKSSNERHIIGPHLVKVHSVTKSSNEGHILGPHLVEVRSMTNTKLGVSSSSFMFNMRRYGRDWHSNSNSKTTLTARN